MAIWLTSDTHFGHERIITLCNRPFESVDEMNEVMIERFNEVVRPNDFVFHLGDVALGKIAESLPLVGRLNGIKFLIPGNHDRIFSGEKQKQRDRFLPAYSEVFNGGILPEIFNLTEHVIASHFPFNGDSQENDRHPDKRPVDDGSSFLVHGHIHDKRKIDGRMFNVGVDVNDFRPVALDEVIDWMRCLTG